jgi:integrase
MQGRAIRPKIIVALFCGLRRGELLALRWSAVDLDAGVLHVREVLEQTRAHGIRVKAPKTAAGKREVTLPDIVVETLRDHRREQLELRMKLGLGKLTDDAYVFCSPLDGAPQSPQALTVEWATVAEAIGMGDITLHALRHTHASMLIAAGLDVVTVSKRLGHASPAITLKVYAHCFKQRDDTAAAAINSALSKLGR